MALEETGFFLSEKPKCHPINLFSDHAYFHVNKPVDVDKWPKTCNKKNIHHVSIFKIFTQQQNKWEVGCVLLANILPPTNVPSPRYGSIYIIISSPIGNHKQYEVIIGNFPTCTCIDFVLMMTGSLSACGKWVHCKHLDYILQHVMVCGLMEMFIHHLTCN
jgi:hypothetical protein